MRLSSDEGGLLREVSERFTFFVPGYEWMPKYRAGQWDGKIKLMDFRKSLLPVGLFSELKKYCRAEGIELEVDTTTEDWPGKKGDVTPERLVEFVKGLNIHVRGEPAQVRDYQLAAIHAGISSGRVILKSPTGSGKSLIVYVLARWFLEHREDRVLVIVPTTNLVTQMYDDFADYSSADPTWNVKDEVHKVFSGQEKVNVHERTFVSTWQSIYKLPPAWFSQFGTIFGDEAHLFTANSLTGSMKKATRAVNRIGTTGTLSGAATHEMVLNSCFGPIFSVTTTRKLQEEDTLAQLRIRVLNVRHDDPPPKRLTYQKEIAWLVSSQERNDLIRDLVLSLRGNTLLLFQYVEKHGKVLYDLIRNSTDTKTFFVAGEVGTEDRNAVKDIVESQTNSITVASTGVFSTGVNIRNIHNLVFGAPFKSQVRVLQSIGRGLRKSDNGRATTLYDIVDDLSSRPRRNYALLHGLERQKIYDSEGFEYSISTVRLKRHDREAIRRR